MKTFNEMLNLLNYCDSNNIEYNLVNEIDQIRIELFINKKCLNISAIFRDDICALFHGTYDDTIDTYNVDEIDEILKL